MYSIRKAVPADALGIAIVNVYTWKTAYTGLIPDRVIDTRVGELEERARQCLEGIKKEDNVLVATVENTIVGFCIYTNSRYEAYKDAGEMVALYVLEGFHGKGIGKALFLEGVQRLIEKHYNVMYLHCVRHNPSLAFYIHMGGKVVGQHADEILGASVVTDIVCYDNLNALLMERESYHKEGI